MERESEIIEIKIENATSLTATWIIFPAYKFVEDGKAKTVEIREVKKSEHSIDMLLTIVLSAVGYKIIDSIHEEMGKRIKKWRERKKMLKVWVNGEEIY